MAKKTGGTPADTHSVAHETVKSAAEFIGKSGGGGGALGQAWCLYLKL